MMASWRLKINIRLHIFQVLSINSLYFKFLHRKKVHRFCTWTWYPDMHHNLTTFCSAWPNLPTCRNLPSEVGTRTFRFWLLVLTKWGSDRYLLLDTILETFWAFLNQLIIYWAGFERFWQGLERRRFWQRFWRRFWQRLYQR